jgi:uncharacterized protein YbjT (DUF2867 family)
MNNSKVLVVGASGVVGSQLVDILKAQGRSVRATTSDKSKITLGENGERTLLNLVSGEGLQNAFEGVDSAFLMSPAGYVDQHKVLSPLIAEAKRRGLKKVVLMTAMGANAVDTSPMRLAEVELEQSGLAFNIIRPNWFLQNFNTFWIQGILSLGKIMLPVGNAKVSFIDARDIAAVAARLLDNNKFDNQAFDLTGAESIDHAFVASVISKVTGKVIAFENISSEVFKQSLLGVGMPADYVDFIAYIVDALREGHSARMTTSVADILGRQPLGINTYAKDYRSSWL